MFSNSYLKLGDFGVSKVGLGLELGLGVGLGDVGVSKVRVEG